MAKSFRCSNTVGVVCVLLSLGSSSCFVPVLVVHRTAPDSVSSANNVVCATAVNIPHSSPSSEQLRTGCSSKEGIEMGKGCRLLLLLFSSSSSDPPPFGCQYNLPSNPGMTALDAASSLEADRVKRGPVRLLARKRPLHESRE